MVSSYYKDIYGLLCKRYPNRKIYVISDHHFYHVNIIKYQRSEFSNVMEMNDYIINSHNSVVGVDDIVIFLGDFCFKKAVIKDLLGRMNGHKYLLLGNHDEDNLIRCYGNLGFEGIFTNPVKINDNFLSHYPLKDDELEGINFKLLIKEFNKSNGINYHGHIHTTDIGAKPYANVCCEAQAYKPLLIGYTESPTEKGNDPLIINSSDFEDILKFVKENRNLDPNLIISDYIYSMLLETVTPYNSSSFVYGSFPIYKKYGYVSNFSDLDVCFIYNESLSKNKNSALFKESFDKVFERAKTIYNLNLSINKRIANMRIFELLYTSKSGNTYRGYYDTNLVPLNVYRDTDFINTCGCSTLESVLKQDGNLIERFKFPRYESKFLTVNGDLANIILQLLFQQGFMERKYSALKKLKYIYRTHGDKDISNVKCLEDVMIRFFIRNIVFFHTTNRRREIEYINTSYKNIDNLINDMPLTLRLQIEEILKNPNSLFNTVYNDLKAVSFEEIPEKGKELIKIIK